MRRCAASRETATAAPEPFTSGRPRPRRSRHRLARPLNCKVSAAQGTPCRRKGKQKPRRPLQFLASTNAASFLRHNFNTLLHRPRPPPGKTAAVAHRRSFAPIFRLTWAQQMVPAHGTLGVAPRPRKRRNRPTARPGREPCLTGLSLGGDEPADFRLATGPGTNEYRDRPGRVPRHSRLAPRSGAAGVRMSVGCGSSSACGARSRTCFR